MAKGDKRYAVTASVTISIHGVVWARNAKEAREKALDMPMGNINEGQYQADEEWHTSGELDGSAKGITVVQEDE
jgi:hypothetical protein